jgi:hypothetical protein
VTQLLFSAGVGARASSPDDVKALLFEAATRLDMVGSELTPQAAHIIVQEDLLPAFLGS